MLKKGCREIRDLVSPQGTATPPNLLPSLLEQDFRAHNAILVSNSRRCEYVIKKSSANMAEPPGINTYAPTHAAIRSTTSKYFERVVNFLVCE